MSESEAMEAASIASISYTGFEPGLWGIRPFRAPHHTASGVALVGGGCDFHKLMRQLRNRCDNIPNAASCIHEK